LVDESSNAHVIKDFLRYSLPFFFLFLFLKRFFFPLLSNSRSGGSEAKRRGCGRVERGGNKKQLMVKGEKGKIYLRK
jgi:hypothetical protein